MSNILKATCKNGIVKANGLTIEEVEILGDGNGESEGVLILDGLDRYYIPQGKPDIRELIELLNDSMTMIKDIFQSIGSGMTGSSTAPPPTLANDLLALNDKIIMINGLKDELL